MESENPQIWTLALKWTPAISLSSSGSVPEAVSEPPPSSGRWSTLISLHSRARSAAASSSSFSHIDERRTVCFTFCCISATNSSGTGGGGGAAAAAGWDEVQPMGGVLDASAAAERVSCRATDGARS